MALNKEKFREKAENLIKNMTIDEKLRQMNTFRWDIDKTYEQISNGEDIPVCGAIFSNVTDTEHLKVIQDYCIEKTGIPVLVASEGIRGIGYRSATVFPQSAGLGGSFNRSFVNRMADIIGEEARTVGMRQLYAPNIDIQREPRWGRMQESYGEDPYLVGEMGREYVLGLQKHGVAATLKHYIAYGLPEGGINLAPAHIGEREIREVMLEPFEKCVDAGALSVMPSYNEIDGVPVHMSKKYLQDVLRGELGFDGMIISDYGAIEMLDEFHGIASDKCEAGKLALEAGVDMEALAIFGYGEEMREAVIRKEIDEKLIDEAVMRILMLKYELGIFDNPYALPENMGKIRTKNASKLALEMEEQSTLLLENDGILPLSEEKIGKIAVIGNNAKDTFLGDYISPKEHCIDFYTGMVNRLGNDKVLYSRGCNPISGSDKMIEDAVETASKADVVFLVLGDNAGIGGGIPESGGEIRKEITCSEGYDTTDLGFTKWQKKLFDAVTALGKPTVLVLYAGRTYAIPEEVSKVNGFMFSWGGGEHTGTAMANLIFGDVSPSAKLSISFPKSVGHLPCYYNYKVSARGRWYKNPGSYEKPGQDYILTNAEPWYPFGYGLSYTEVDYSNLTAENSENGEVKVSVDVTNSGNYEINESVLLFVRALRCPVTPFIKRLKNFEKVNLKPGETKKVEMVLKSDAFTYIDMDYKKAVCRGKHKILVSDLECEIEI